MSTQRPTRLAPAGWWIILCAYLHWVGWGLSAIHQLNRTGYAIALASGLVALVLWARHERLRILPRLNIRKLRRRFRRPFPLAFLILATLAIVGGVIHAPTNFDALSCRITRVLHWLAEERWHWIHTAFGALNTRVCGIEWVSTPLIAFTGSYRLVFLPNAISFLLLPGLIFSVFRRLGVNPRVAWHWMWVLPTGYCYLLQAGSAANDMFGAPFALGAIDFALRAKESRKFSDFGLAILSAALMTSVKSSNLPLLLPAAVALLPSARLVLRRPIATCAALLVATLCSFAPTAGLNVKYSGDWTGRVAEMMPEAFKGYPFTRFTYNLVAIPVYNLAPPIFPMAEKVNAWLQAKIPSYVAEKLRNCFGDEIRVRFVELQAEEFAGVGLGVAFLAIASLIAGIREQNLHYASGGDKSGLKSVRFSQLTIIIASFVALGFLMAKGGWPYPARYLAPYYPLVLPLALLGVGPAKLVHRGWWRGAAAVVFVIAGALLMLSPARPLWPAKEILEKLGGEHSPNPLVARAYRVYAIYSERSDAFGPVRRLLSPDIRILGFVTWADPEASLWMPWSSRRILHVCANDSPEDLRRKGIRYVLVKEAAFHWPFKSKGPNWPFTGTFAQWCARQNAQLIRTFSLDLRASGLSETWHLVELQ